ncbi:hypothetical protein Rsub_10621 [Raphidocelis subcapitata]|uniref:Uncharacterized protein n=1 Tax=Raphidocelis subcapitata TaxID=307507 RepID=A0A2V0PDL8_9CHLO|nr:hypothetical protein Rsub_10621 [Raphidocelis subcapitata]|eukprot:GBF97948.1 hypothetical protein Rsub_10621 [Raphidocelis subcapitata]
MAAYEPLLTAPTLLSTGAGSADGGGGGGGAGAAAGAGGGLLTSTQASLLDKMRRLSDASSAQQERLGRLLRPGLAGGLQPASSGGSGGGGSLIAAPAGIGGRRERSHPPDESSQPQHSSARCEAASAAGSGAVAAVGAPARMSYSSWDLSFLAEAQQAAAPPGAAGAAEVKHRQAQPLASPQAPVPMQPDFDPFLVPQAQQPSAQPAQQAEHPCWQGTVISMRSRRSSGASSRSCEPHQQAQPPQQQFTTGGRRSQRAGGGSATTGRGMQSAAAGGGLPPLPGVRFQYLRRAAQQAQQRLDLIVQWQQEEEAALGSGARADGAHPGQGGLPQPPSSPAAAMRRSVLRGLRASVAFSESPWQLASPPRSSPAADAAAGTAPLVEPEGSPAAAAARLEHSPATPRAAAWRQQQLSGAASPPPSAAADTAAGSMWEQPSEWWRPAATAAAKGGGGSGSAAGVFVQPAQWGEVVGDAAAARGGAEEAADEARAAMASLAVAARASPLPRAWAPPAPPGGQHTAASQHGEQPRPAAASPATPIQPPSLSPARLQCVLSGLLEDLRALTDIAERAGLDDAEAAELADLTSGGALAELRTLLDQSAASGAASAAAASPVQPPAPPADTTGPASVVEQHQASVLSALLALSPDRVTRGSAFCGELPPTADHDARGGARSSPTDETRPLRLHSGEDVDALLAAAAAAQPAAEGGCAGPPSGSEASGVAEAVDPFEAAAIEALACGAGIALLPAAPLPVSPAALPAAGTGRGAGAALAADPLTLPGMAVSDELCELGSPVGVRHQQAVPAARNTAGGGGLVGNGESLPPPAQEMRWEEDPSTWRRPGAFQPNQTINQWLAEQPSPARPPLRLQPQPQPQPQQGPQAAPAFAGISSAPLTSALPPLPPHNHHHPRYAAESPQEDAAAAPPSGAAVRAACRAEGASALQPSQASSADGDAGLGASAAPGAAGDWESLDLGSLSLGELRQVLTRARGSFAFDPPRFDR